MDKPAIIIENENVRPNLKQCVLQPSLSKHVSNLSENFQSYN